MDDAESTLLILADPITWRWRPHIAGEGIWEGDTDGAHYHIRAPTRPNNVDAPLLDRLWSLSITVRGNEQAYVTLLVSLEQAKAICLRHAGNGNMAEVNALNSAAKAKAFREKEKITSKQLFTVVQKRPVLVFMNWHPGDLNGRDATEFSAMGKGGAYSVRFDPARRWVVRRTEHGKVKDEHCFVTGTLAKIACTVHNFTGGWYGMLPEE